MKSVPKFMSYYPTIKSMNQRQKKFYYFLKESLLKGEPVPVDNQISYIFCYLKKEIFQKINSVDGLNLILSNLQLLVDYYKDEKHLVPYLETYIADCYVLLGKYRDAISWLQSRDSRNINLIFSIKLILGDVLDGKDVLNVCGKQHFTNFGKNHIPEIASEITAEITREEKELGVNLLISFAENIIASGRKGGFQCYGKWFFFENKTVTSFPHKFFYFSSSEFVRDKVTRFIIDSENKFRVNNGLPKIGEGWISETELYYKIKNKFSDYEVIHHGKAKWLGRQHLDIFIPELKIAVEYQGKQHFEPVDFFGGEEGYLKTKERDDLKKEKCRKNNVLLIEVEEGYDIKDVFEKINLQMRKVLELHSAKAGSIYRPHT
jgi:hypothetical protein